MLELKPKTNSQSSNSKTLTASPTAEGQSWAERYAPTSLVDLSLHHSKRTVLTNWLTRAIEYDVRNGNRLPVLVVYGGSGIGKSSAVQILCSELGIRVVEWTQDMLESESVSKSTISDDGSYLRQIPAEMVHSSSFTRQLYSLRVNDSGRKERLESHFNSARYPPLLLRDRNGKILSKSATTKHSGATCGQILLIHDPHSVEDHAFGHTNDLILQSTTPVVLIVSGPFERDDKFNVLRSYLSQPVRNFCEVDCVFWTPVTATATVKTLASILKKERIAASVVSASDLQDIASQSMGDVRHAIIDLELLVKARQYRSNANGGGQRSAAEIIDMTQEDGEHSDEDAQRDRVIRKKANKRRKQSSHDDPLDKVSKLRGDGEEVESSAGSRNRRDASSSLIHTIARLLHAKLDQYGYADIEIEALLESSDCSCDYLLSSLAANATEFIEEQLSIPTLSTAGMEGDNVDEDVATWDGAEERSSRILEAISVHAELISFTELLHSRKYDSHAHLDRSSDSIFPEPYVFALASRAGLVAKGIGLKERTVMAREVFHYKSPFRGLKVPRGYRLRRDQQATRSLIHDMKWHGIVSWIEFTSREKEDVDRDDFLDSMITSQYEEPASLSQKYMLPSYSLGEWEQTIVPYCRAMARTILSARTSMSPPPLLVDWMARKMVQPPALTDRATTAGSEGPVMQEIEGVSEEEGGGEVEYLEE